MMPLFEYKAVAPNGDTLSGTMEAASSDLVVIKLQENGNIPLMAREAGGGGFNLTSLRLGRQGMNAREVGQFTHQLGTLLAAGLPLDRSLQVLAELADNERIQRVISSIRDRVREGDALSESLQDQHGSFNRLYINMVRAGEIGGTLDVTLQRLADYLERSKELKDSVVSAMIYPALLLMMAVGSLILLLVYVIPQFTPIFEDLGTELPLLTQVVLAAATVIKKFWWFLIAAGIGAVWLFRQMLSDPERRRGWDQFVLNRKWIGDLVAKLETARLSRTLGTLLTNGVPLLSALSIGQKVVSNTPLRDDVKAAAKEVKTGGGLARNLAKGKRFPRFALQMISVGEETGQLDSMLVKVADAFDKEVHLAVERLMALLVPVLTLAMAGLIGIIVMAVLLPMLSLYDVVG